MINNVEKAVAIAEHILQESFAAVISREIMNHFAKAFKKLPNDSVLELGEIVLDLIQPKLANFELEESLIRNEVGEVLFAKKRYGDSARCLQKINLTNPSREVTEDEKATTYVKIAERWFHEDDAVNAEIYLNKATHIMYDVDNPDLNIRYKYWKAKVYDSKRSFVLAAQAYYDLSTTFDGPIDKDALLELLKNAVTCSILAPAGSQKSRSLTTLYKDERTRQLPNYDILEKMFTGRVIKKSLAESFEATLEEHQKATATGGVTVLEKAVLEHNIQVVSNIYQTITFDGLGRFLGIAKVDAEKLISNMAAEGRISAVLDQKDEIIEFEKNEREKLSVWNDQIGTLCNDVNLLLSKILTEYPEGKKFEVK